MGRSVTIGNDNIENGIQLITNWPSVHSMVGTKEKTPTEITYLGGAIKWGAAIPPNIQRHIWTKLELDAPRTGEAARIRQELLSSAYGGVAGVKRPVDIIADFLAQVLAHLIKNLNDQYTEKLWKTFSITLVITYPAVWSDAAKALTFKAFEQAGFNAKNLPTLKKTMTATEPEAAALYTITSMRGSAQDQQFAVGDGFVVCDMGGGTVDLISYKIVGVNPTAIEEATVGTGDQCGGSFVERAFLQWLEDKLGAADFRDIAGCSVAELSRTSLPPRLGKMMQEFTATAKSGFRGRDSDDYEVRLPAPLNAIVEDQARSISNGEILITPTRHLVMQQLKEARRNGKAKIKRKKHREQDSYINEYTGEKYAGNQVEWLINKGQDLSTVANVHGKISMRSLFWLHEARVAKTPLLAADVDDAPPRSNEDAVYEVAQLHVDLGSVPQGEFRKRRNDSGTLFYELNYEIHISVQSSLEYSFWVDGKRYGSVKAEYV
ncbi:hypothetical protein N0V90_007230 [Kalmusia sp. IMI 367209]|nr:hypothetical protein N0V90_007230 [Kalmusia sp. IMI 367209]